MQRKQLIFPYKPLTYPVKQIGLFGTELSDNAVACIQMDTQDHNFMFKKSYFEDRTRISEEGLPYNYRGDSDYFAAIRYLNERSLKGQGNLGYLKDIKDRDLVLLPECISPFTGNNGPIMAARPNENETVSYIWPSYLIWANDPSYLLFSGSPEGLEIPRHVLRKTRGHPQFRNEPGYTKPVWYIDQRLI